MGASLGTGVIESPAGRTMSSVGLDGRLLALILAVLVQAAVAAWRGQAGWMVWSGLVLWVTFGAQSLVAFLGPNLDPLVTGSAVVFGLAVTGYCLLSFAALRASRRAGDSTAA
ncbi:MAG: hypothetical protein AAGN46_12595 [Acidobacteriota bacterium]